MDALLLALGRPLLKDFVAVRCSEGTKVGNLASAKETVTCQGLVLLSKVNSSLSPPRLLSSEASDELLSTVKLDLAQLHIRLQLLLLRLLLGKVSVEGGKFVENDLELVLLDLQGCQNDFEVLLGLGQRNFLWGHHLGDPVIGLHCPHPGAKTICGLGCRLHLLRIKVWVLHVDPDLCDDVGRDVVLVVFLQTLKEVRFDDQLLGSFPVVINHLSGVLILDTSWLLTLNDAHGLHHELDHSRGTLHSLNLCNISLGQRVQGFQGALKEWKSLSQIRLTFSLDGLHLGSLCASSGLLLLHNALDLVGFHGLFGDDLHGLLGLLGTLHELGLEGNQLFLHCLHGRLGKLKLLKSDLVPLLHCHDTCLPVVQDFLVESQQFQVRGGCHVIDSPHLILELCRELVNAGVEEHDCLLDSLDDLVIRNWKIIEEFGCHGGQRILWPGGEPVNSAAIHQCWELPQPLPEVISNWRERENDVEVLLDLLQEEVVKLGPRSIHSSLLGFHSDVLKDGRQITAHEQVWDLVRVEQVRNVLHHALLLDLCVGEQKDDLLVRFTSQLQDLLQVLVPLNLCVRS